MSSSELVSRREFLRLLSAAAAGGPAVLSRSAHAAADSSRKPNIIFIMADDLGYAELGCYGQKEIQTPHIDRLAAEGKRFGQVYAGSTVCAPSRCSLMTGLHIGHCTVRGNFGKGGRVPLRAGDVTVAEVLKKAGYATGMVGKWGLGEPGTSGVPNKQGFDYWFGFLNQRRAHSYYPPYVWRNQKKFDLPGNAGGKRRQYVHDLFTEEVLSFIDRSAATGSGQAKPFFLYVPYTIPHAKFEVPSDEPYSKKDWPQSKKNYAAMVTRMDRDVGRIVARLKQHGLDRNTIIFFTSDNGACSPRFFNGSGPLRGMKRAMYEGGIRVPMIVRWPGRISAGTTSDHVWAFWDFLPTAAEIAGAKAPAGIDGISMLPALLGGKGPRHDHLYWEFYERGFQQAARMGDFKAVRLGTGKPTELYNLREDLGEKQDLAAHRPELLKQMEEIMRKAHVESPYWPVKGSKKGR